VQALGLRIAIKQNVPEVKEKVKEDKKGDDQKAKNEAKGAAAADAASIPSLSKLDLRVGRIVSVEKHPNADTLYVEQVDLGEDKPRQVVSGLVKFVPIEEMRNRLVLVLCNVKPSNMRSVRSEAMVIAASNEDHTQVQLVDPAPGSKVGERVTTKGQDGKTDSQINLSSKPNTFSILLEHLHTNDKNVAVFNSEPLSTSAGPCTVKSMPNAHLG